MDSSRLKFGKAEMIGLLINTISLQIFLNYPRTMAEHSGTAGWILSIYTGIIVFIIFAIIAKLYSQFEGKDILDVSEYLAGNTGRIFMGVAVMLHTSFAISIILREFSENMKTISLTSSPISYVTFFFIVCIMAASYFGIESLARTNLIIQPVITIAFIIIMIGALPYADINNLFPIWGNGIENIFIKGIKNISSYSAIIILFIFFPFIRTNKIFKISGFTGIILSAIFFTISTITYTMVYPYPESMESFLPIFRLSRLINFGRFFQRIESVFLLIWASAAFTYLSAMFFLIVYIFAKTFKLEYYKPLILPFLIIIFTASLLPGSLVEAINLETVYFRSVAWIVPFGLTTLVLLLANLKKKYSRKGIIRK